MIDIQMFQNPNFGEIRVATGENGEPLFCLSDICRVLEIIDVSRCASRLEDDVRQTHPIIDSLNREQQATFVNEEGLYEVVIRSDKNSARPFRKWICGEVLPSIRKNGMYATETTIDKILNDPEFGIQLLTKLKEEKQARIQAEKTVAILTHTNKTYTCTEIAKELGFKSAIELNKTLQSMGIQFKQNNTWVPYSKYSNLAWFDIKQEVNDFGKIIYHRRITGLGREGIINLINNQS